MGGTGGLSGRTEGCGDAGGDGWEQKRCGQDEGHGKDAGSAAGPRGREGVAGRPGGGGSAESGGPGDAGEVLEQITQGGLGAPSLEVYKPRLHGTLGSLIWCLI